MSLSPGSRLGVYEVTALLGEGGMGQVFRARDTKLNRDVALKVLPDSLASDADRLARFTREAQMLAALNHPNIAHIHGLEESGGVRALVMELVEGEDLSQRIARGAIPLDEALPIARQIAEALEAAHEQGIIHRDLKPANIKVRADGTVKVLDFGLAKAIAQDPKTSGPQDLNDPNLAQAPTITTPAMTQAGMILGTAAYMSPEQARGKTVDKRADIWAFGAVLFEILTGRRAFPGDDITDTIVAVISKEPDWAALPATTPAGVRQILARCLKKDARARLQSIGDARVQVEELLSGATPGGFETALLQTMTPGAAAAPRGRRALIAALAVAAAAVVAAVALAVPAVRHFRETPPAAPPETRTEIVTPATDSPQSFALSPNGRQIVYLASGDGASRLWLRSLATTTAQPLAGTEEARYPFWSPDGRSIGFFAGSALKRLDLGGGAPQTLAPVLAGQGGTWGADGVIVFAPGTSTDLMRVSATGGAVVAVTRLGPQQLGHRYPHFLPDGLRFLFFAQGAPDTVGIYLGALDGRAPIRLTRADSGGVYLPADAWREGGPRSTDASRDDGWLLWVRAATVVAQRLDVAQAALTGDPVTLADGVDGDSLLKSPISVATTGVVAYRTGGAGVRQLVWVDRTGTARGIVGDADANNLSNPRVSPDGRRVVVTRVVQGNTDLWLLDRDRTIRFIFDAAFDGFPLWSTDGSRIAWFSARTASGDIYQKRTSGTGDEERLVASEQGKVPVSWSPDGRFVLYHSLDPQTSGDLWVAPIAGVLRDGEGGSSASKATRTPWVFLKTPFDERWGTFSPDGRWVAYQSNESGRLETYVRAFVPPGATGAAVPLRSGPAAGATGGQWQVSTAGGVFPVWRPDGHELYYLNPAGAMMAAPITVTGATLDPGAPVVLFPARIAGGGVESLQGRQYDVAPDGRFLINRAIDEAPAPITLLQNWHPEGKE